ncbi:MAG: cyaA 2 [Lacunisphaera sp.]|nr:cyaA 2 [Lacunisphaera sp.]
MAFRVFRFRRFSSELLFLVAGLVAVVQIAVYFFISHYNEKHAIEHIEQNLQMGARIFQQNLAERIDYLAGSAKVMSSDYPIRQLVMQDPLDKRTLRSALATYSERVKAPVIMLFSAEGEPLAWSDDDLGLENVGPFQRSLIPMAAKDELEQASGYSYLAKKLHVLVVVPLYAPAPNIAGWFGVAYPIDTKFAQAIKSTTRLEVSFTSDDPEESQPHVLTSTLDAPMAAELARHKMTPKDSPLQSEIVTLNGEPYVTLFQQLDLLGEAPVRIALQRSLAAELAPARELENVVLLISLAALAAATLAALWIARGVSQPVRRLAEYTKHVATGDYTRRIDLPREDELGQLATAFNQMTAGLAERDRVRDLLGKVVSPEIATQLLHSDLKLGGEEREVTILFCDLRNFTGMSEKMAPSDVLTLLNRYLDRMSAIIERHGGVIDKYIGDAIMALFGAPVSDPAAPVRAVAAAREMAQALAVLNRELVAESLPPLAFGIGINTARVVAGNMGSKTRLNYTVIGDGVNLASRLETLTKDPAYDTPIIISEATLRALPNPPPVRELGEVQVKGKADAVRIFALSGKGESTPPYSV